MFGQTSPARRLVEAVTGPDRGPARFERELDRAVAEAGAPGGPPLCLALVGLDGVEALTTRNGRRWADRRVLLAAQALADLEPYDQGLTGYRTGALTFSVLLRGVRLTEAFGAAELIWRAVTRPDDGLHATVGLAALDGDHAADALTLEIAADAALDQARSLGQPAEGLVVAAAPAGSGLRWLSARSARSASSSSAAV